mgnify:FL=1
MRKEAVVGIESNLPSVCTITFSRTAQGRGTARRDAAWIHKNDPVSESETDWTESQRRREIRPAADTPSPLHLFTALKKYTSPFPSFIHTRAGLDPGCQKVAELIVSGEVMGELLEPAQPVFRPVKLGEVVDKAAIDHR